MDSTRGPPAAGRFDHGPAAPGPLAGPLGDLWDGYLRPAPGGLRSRWTRRPRLLGTSRGNDPRLLRPGALDGAFHSGAAAQHSQLREHVLIGIVPVTTTGHAPMSEPCLICKSTRTRVRYRLSAHVIAICD